VLVVFGALLIIGLVWFIWSIAVRPELKLTSPIRQLKGQLKAAIQRSAQSTADPNEMNWQRYYSQSQAAQERLARIRAQMKKGRPDHRKIRVAFYVDWDPNSFSSLEEHANSLTHVIPEWFTLRDVQGDLITERDQRLATYAASRGLTVMPLLDNLAGDTWQPEAVENLALGSADRRETFINDLITGLKAANAGGVVIDWEQLDPNYRDKYTDLLGHISEALHTAGMELWFVVNLGEDFNTFDVEKLQGPVDRFLAILHDENSESDKPGPIASQAWLEGWLKVIADQTDPDQWIGILGSYAYDWNLTLGDAETISFKDAMSRASYAGVDQQQPAVSVAAPSYNGMYSYSEPRGEHSVSFLDAISFYNQLRAVRAAGLGGIGLRRLGTEDPQVWDVLDWKERPTAASVATLEKLRANLSITHVGRGEIVSVDETKEDGERRVELEPSGNLHATYVEFPTYPILYHEGAGEKHQVAITFDDGPDPEWTPKILDILKARGVKACFFLVGQNAENNPRLVERIFREGHEIGNHTYNHANLAIMSPLRMRLELNATQRVIESITGHSTTLFRPPYNADSNPTKIEELVPLKLAQDELGYTVVLEKVDPQDWARPGADAIVQRVKDLRGEGNIVLLHDAGGDRSETVEALPRIIDYLETRGDRIVPLSELLKVSREELMPDAALDRQDMERMVSGTGFRMWHATVEFFWALMIFATALIAIRTLLVAWLAHRHHQHAEAERGGAATRTMAPTEIGRGASVIIAAYNEGKVIENTLRSVLKTNFTGPLEVLVIDDGSQDDTSAAVERIASTDPRVRLIQQPNRGKASALGNGLSHASHELLVFLDADTHFEPETIPALLRPFVKPLVGAVSGNARVGNLRSFIARCQSLEYICGFNLDRRAYTEWNCITVVPGAISAFRKSAIKAAGGFSHDTLAEDTDLTLTLHRLRYRIDFADDAIAWTEAPETFATLAKQRFRWAFGTMQCLWKHRDIVFNPRFGALGWFSLPSIWIFQIALVALTPLVDAILIWSILFGHATAIWSYFLAFLVLDLFLAALACWMEGERIRRALMIVPMRLVYRPLLAWVIWRSILRAFKGALVGWGKLERTASVPTRA
jgi:cellulose synthase/poly-beta-1,6-N-acetylglucosamine synthase-like glycosyltransferase/peptidoglycan/xylan/chitin deacetylase (PgdA/CDA1 family)/spore germination protein YaaH